MRHLEISAPTLAPKQQPDTTHEVTWTHDVDGAVTGDLTCQAPPDALCRIGCSEGPDCYRVELRCRRPAVHEPVPGVDCLVVASIYDATAGDIYEGGPAPALSGPVLVRWAQFREDVGAWLWRYPCQAARCDECGGAGKVQRGEFAVEVLDNGDGTHRLVEVWLSKPCLQCAGTGHQLAPRAAPVVGREPGQGVLLP
jgi:hypothetical protein